MVSDKKINLALDKLIDEPFYFGDSTGKKGWDCLSMLKSFYTDMGVNFPTSFEGYTESNYVQKWNEDSEKGRDALDRFLGSLGRPIEPEDCQPGDLIIIDGKLKPMSKPDDRSGIFPAVYLGDLKILMVMGLGSVVRVRVLRLKHFVKFIKGARRLL